MRVAYVKWFWRDYENEELLWECSVAARAVWPYMLAAMSKADPHGFFVSPTGGTIDIVNFAARFHFALKDVRATLKEVVEKRVASVDSQGRIFSRRMVADHAKYILGAENGVKGGSPLLNLSGYPKPLTPGVNQSGYPSTLTEGVKARDNPSRARSSEAQKLSNSDSLRSSALGFEKWPEGVEELRGLALIFLAAFGNCRDPLKAERHLPAYTELLAVMRSRGVGIAAAWSACADARMAHNDKPLFGASIKAALAFLPTQKRRNDRPGPEYPRFGDAP